ncbi:TPA: hypothetical protein ACGIZG_001586 [Corynebacterium striatum]|nr:hypothetical protein [Corynebacterium striatum]HAT6563669.1 hypothetical protein [Corynebacterium striatum]HAT6569021.1 hypothetical protein [Corynebacterium striatum]HAT6625292.1 hypothetical protein [Corynebacterium striatum]HCG2976154.1 hypothetical protein [Corynebacterium striatum]
MGFGIALSLTCLILLIAVNSILAAERQEMKVRYRAALADIEMRAGRGF